MDLMTEGRMLDEEWVELMKEAKSVGLTPEEVRMFLGGVKINKY